jgi:hypothetical protein
MAVTQIALTPSFVWPSRQRVVSAILTIATLIAIGVYAPSFFRYHNIINVLLQASLLGLLAIGMTIVMIDGLKVGFSLDTKESSLETAWVDFLKSEGEKQGKAAGFDIQWTINVANADPTRQAANIDDLITRGVDVIIARAFDSGAIGTSIKAAKEAGIPFITFDRGSTSGTPTAHVGGDSYDEAKTTGEAFAEILSCERSCGDSGDHQRHAESLVARLQIDLRRYAKETGAFDAPPPTASLATIQDTSGSFKRRRQTVIVIRKSAFFEPQYRRRFSPAPAAMTAAGARIRPAIRRWPWFGKDALGRAWRGR